MVFATVCVRHLPVFQALAALGEALQELADLEGARLPKLHLHEVLAAALEVVPDTLIVVLYPLAQLLVRPPLARRQARDAAVDQPLTEVPMVAYAFDVILYGSAVEDEPAAGVLVVQLPQERDLGPVAEGAAPGNGGAP